MENREKTEREQRENSETQKKERDIYIYICRRVSFGTTFLPFQELETVPPKKKIILTAARSKSRVRNRPTG